MEDERIEEIYDEFEKKTEPKQTDYLKKIPTGVLVVLGIAGVFIFWQMIVMGQNLKNMLVLFLLIAGFLWLISRQGSSKILTEQEIKISLFKKLKWKQRNPLGGFYEVPEGKIKVGPACNLLTVAGKPWRWPVLVRIEGRSGLEETYVADMDPFTGNLLSIVETQRGFRGDERPHIKWIEAPNVAAEKRYYESTGRSQRKSFH